MNARSGRGIDKQRVKDALDAMGAKELCGALGLLDGRWNHQADGVIVLCPHGEKKPSLSVRLCNDGIAWRCHSCGQTGSDALSLVAFVHGLDCGSEFNRVLDHACAIAGIANTSTHEAPTRKRQTPTVKQLPARGSDAQSEAFAGIVDVLLSDPLTSLDRHVEPADERQSCGCGCVDVRRYLDDRGILEPAMRDNWRSLPVRDSERQELIAHIVARVGMDAWKASEFVWSWSDKKTDERKCVASEFRRKHHRVIIPWRDRSGRVTALQRRFLYAITTGTYPHRRLITSTEDSRIPASAKSAIGEGKYDNAGKVLDPYGAHRIASRPSSVALMLVEGACDALAVEALSPFVPAVTGCVALGLGGSISWRDEWSEWMRGRKILIGLDADKKKSARAATDHKRHAIVARMCATADFSMLFPGFVGAEQESVKDWSDVLDHWRR